MDMQRQIEAEVCDRQAEPAPPADLDNTTLWNKVYAQVSDLLPRLTKIGIKITLVAPIIGTFADCGWGGGGRVSDC
jgi:hypothetical protein